MGVSWGCLVVLFYTYCWTQWMWIWNWTLNKIWTIIFSWRFHVDKLSSAHVYLRLHPVSSKKDSKLSNELIFWIKYELTF